MIRRILLPVLLLSLSLASYASETILTAAVNNQTDKSATPYYAVLNSQSVLSDNGLSIYFVDQTSKDMPAGTTSIIYLETTQSNTTGTLSLVYTISTTNNPEKGGSIGTCTFTLNLSAVNGTVSVNDVQPSCNDTLGVNASYTTASTGQLNLNIK